jgi:hypothetical protein
VIRTAGRALTGAALLAAATAMATGAGAGAPTLEVSVAGEVVARLPLGPEGRFCLHWNHSVTGGAVADCFRAEASGLVLERSYLHDFAAGLGHTPGQGEQRPAEGGGYWIEGIDRPLPQGALALRVGRPAVGHRIETAAGARLALSALLAGRRVRLALALPGG